MKRCNLILFITLLISLLAMCRKENVITKEAGIMATPDTDKAAYIALHGFYEPSYKKSAEIRLFKDFYQSNRNDGIFIDIPNRKIRLIDWGEEYLYSIDTIVYSPDKNYELILLPLTEEKFDAPLMLIKQDNLLQVKATDNSKLSYGLQNPFHHVLATSNVSENMADLDEESYKSLTGLYFPLEKANFFRKDGSSALFWGSGDGRRFEKFVPEMAVIHPEEGVFKFEGQDYQLIKTLKRGPDNYLLTLREESGKSVTAEKINNRLILKGKSLVQVQSLTAEPLHYTQKTYEDLEGYYAYGNNKNYLMTSGQPSKYKGKNQIKELPHGISGYLISLADEEIFERQIGDWSYYRILDIHYDEESQRYTLTALPNYSDGSHSLTSFYFQNGELTVPKPYRDDDFFYTHALSVTAQQEYMATTLPWKTVNTQYDEYIPLPDLSSVPKAAKKDTEQFNTDFFTLLDGSTATLPLSVSALRYFSGVLTPAQAEEQMNHTMFDDEAAIPRYILKEDKQNKDYGEHLMMEHSTTHKAYEKLISQKGYTIPQLILVVSPSKEELALAASLDVELEIVPIAKEAFVFMVNKDNPVTNLSIKELQKIYQGEITNWNQLKNGHDEPIIAYQRNKESGSQRAMVEMVMQNKPLMQAPTNWVHGFMGSLIERAFPFDGGQGSIGYVTVFMSAK